MSVAIWPFRFALDGFKERPVAETSVTRYPGGRREAQQQWGSTALRVDGSVILDAAWGSYDDFEAFVAARAGQADPFLYKRQMPGLATVTDTPEVDDAGQTDFLASKRYVDTATLVVKKNDVTQTLTTHYSILNTSGGAYALGDAGMMVRFVTPPGIGNVVTLTYDFYYPVSFVSDDPMAGMAIERLEVASGDCLLRLQGVSLMETGPGFHLRSVPVS